MAYRILTSSLGKKLGMALTGLVLHGFLLGHLVGNTLLLRADGGESFNSYSDFLITHPLILPVEAFLLICFVLHIYLAICVSLENRRARGSAYEVRKSVGGRTWASFTMIYSGLLVLVFIVLHLKTFKYGDRGDGTLFELVSQTFRQPAYLVFYAVSMVILGFHLWHAFQSAVQTLGLGGQRLRAAGLVFCVLIAAGFGFLPIYLGILTN
jgi:succinate dehydrogenase / fumarate reductase, cytochrome b subunit